MAANISEVATRHEGIEFLVLFPCRGFHRVQYFKWLNYKEFSG